MELFSNLFRGCDAPTNRTSDSIYGSGRVAGILLFQHGKKWFDLQLLKRKICRTILKYEKLWKLQGM
ncbi:hypothetical protein BEI62_17645 [Eisenbergiella tayi]|nr:hypothetical protein BEI62_17645 [Eisenbergiella tayi]RJW38572.1 hypothetical protein DXC97_14325 [Lachnospiraceae bacterium TF09-5]